MKTSAFTSGLVAGLALAGSATTVLAGAAPTAIAPLATADGARLVVIGAPATDMVWNGSGRLSRQIALCITSPTGRYRLTVGSATRGLTGRGETLAYDVKFTDGMGVEQSGNSRQSAMLAFDGRTPADGSCADGANASLRIELDPKTLGAGVSGNYFDQVQLAVEQR